MSPSKPSRRPRKSSTESPAADNNNELASAYDELNRIWQCAEAKLSSWNLPYEPSVEISRRSYDSSLSDGYYPDETGEFDRGPWDVVCLVLAKYQGQWRICKRTKHVEPDDRWPGGQMTTSSDDRPIVECALHDRVEFSQYLERLIAAGKEVRSQARSRIDAAIAAARAALENLKSDDD